jgi:hypothetical protein
MAAAPALIEAAQAMDAIFWEQAYGNRDSLLQTLSDSLQRRAVRLNYGPWNRLRHDAPLLDAVGPRPPGANFYPTDLSPDALRRADTLRTPHTMVRRLPDGSLTALPYHLFFAESVTSAAFQLRDAAAQMPAGAVRTSLSRRADALLDGAYGPGAEAWHALTAPALDLLLGPMNTGEDRLLGVKEAAAGVVLRRNDAQSRRLAPLLAPLPGRLSIRGLDTLVAPRAVPTQKWGAYDALYVTGGLNTGPKATVLPLAPTGPRRLLLANVLRARADRLLRPTARNGLVDAQQAAVTAEALFAHTALRTWSRARLPDPPPGDRAAAVRTTATATALALALALAPSDTTGGAAGASAHYATAVADLLHTVRVDSTSRDGRAARRLLHLLQDAGALTARDDGPYAVVADTMARRLPALVRTLSAGRPAATTDAGADGPVPLSPALQAVLSRLEAAGVPRGLAFEQGPAVLRSLEAAAGATPNAPRPTGR